MGQRYYGAQGYGYGNPGEMNVDWSVRESGSQLAPSNSDYQVRPDGPVAAVPESAMVPRYSRREAAGHKPRRPTPHPQFVEDFDPVRHQKREMASQRLAAQEREMASQGQYPYGFSHPQLVEDYRRQQRRMDAQRHAAQEREMNAQRQYPRGVAAAPVESRSSVGSSRGSIIEKKKETRKSIAERNPTPGRPVRAPRSVAAPVDSRSSLSSASRTDSVSEESSRRRVARDDSRSSSRKKKKVVKKNKKDSNGSKKNKKNPHKRSSKNPLSKRYSGRKAVRFGKNTSGSSRNGSKHPIDLARRYEAIIARENSISGGQRYNGYINKDFDGGYIDLTSSQGEPGFLVKVPADVMRRALEIINPQKLRDALYEQNGADDYCPSSRTSAPVYQDSPFEEQKSGRRRSSRSSQRRGYY